MESLISIVQCPLCQNKLDNFDQCFVCGKVFEKSNGFSVLIDFDNSILTLDNYKNDIGAARPRLSKGSRLGRALAQFTYGFNDVAEINISKFIKLLGDGDVRVLVVGGGTIGNGIVKLYETQRIEVIGIDVYASPNIVFICDGHKLPFINNCFDGVVIQAVLEHVVDPNRVTLEIHRVLKPGGIVYADTPFMQQVHEGAYDFSRFTLSGHRWLFRKFREIDAGLVSGPGVALIWSISYFFKSLGLNSKLVAIMTAPLFFLRFLERWSKRGPALDSASGLYFMGSKSDDVLKANELPEYYKKHR